VCVCVCVCVYVYVCVDACTLSISKGADGSCLGAHWQRRVSLPL